VIDDRESGRSKLKRSGLLDDYDSTKRGTKQAGFDIFDAHCFFSLPIGNKLPYLFPYILLSVLHRYIYSRTSFLLISSHIDSGFHRTATYFKLSSSHFMSRPRHSTLPVLVCCPKSVYHEYQGNFAGTASFIPSSSNSSSSPSRIDFASTHPDMWTKIRLHPTPMLTLTMSRRKKPPSPNARTKRKLVHALVDVRSRAMGCMKVYLTTIDGDGDSEKRDKPGRELSGPVRCEYPELL